MGYYTDYKVKVQGITKGVETQAIYDKLCEISTYSFDWETDTSWYATSIKWYEYLDDMRILSKLFPDCMFVVDGEGEESGDIWRHYFKNGKHKYVKAILSFPDVHEKDLE